MVCDCGTPWTFLLPYFDPHQVRQHTSMDIGLEIFSTVIFSLLLNPEGQLLVSGERLCTCTGSWSTAQRTRLAQEKVWLGKLTTFDMILMG